MITSISPSIFPSIFFLSIAAYLVGAIPSGYWFAKGFFGVDVTKNGSGTIGATNVARVLGNKGYFFLIFLIDFFKAFIFLYLNRMWPQEILFLFAGLLLVGNGYSIFIRFHGGKGVATLLGIVAVLLPQLLISFFAVGLVILGVTRRVAPASQGGTVALLISYCFFTPRIDYWTVGFLLFLVGWVFWRHK